MLMSAESYPSSTVEQAIKGEEVLLWATAGKIMWWQPAEMIGIIDGQLRRWRKRYEVSGYDGLLDRRRDVSSSKRVPKAHCVLSATHILFTLPIDVRTMVGTPRPILPAHLAFP
jgi:hypothetical protein